MEKIKLYTEEQVKEAIDLARVILNDGSPYPKYIILSEIKGIELPSDEEIEMAAEEKFAYKGTMMGFEIGVKWILERIKQQADNGK